MQTQQDRARSISGSSRASIIDYLATHRVLGGVPKAALLAIAPDVIERRYKKGHYFFRTGDPPSHVFAIISGLASLAEDDDSGRDHALYTLSSGDVFGLAAAILGIPRTRSAKALTDTDVLLVGRETFEDLQRRFPDFARKVTVELCRLLCLSEKNAGQFALRSVTSRLTDLFLDSGPEDSRQHFSSHRELALRVGCSRETITRVLGRLERAGVISARRGQVRIIDRGRLITLVEWRRPDAGLRPSKSFKPKPQLLPVNCAIIPSPRRSKRRRNLSWSVGRDEKMEPADFVGPYTKAANPSKVIRRASGLSRVHLADSVCRFR